MISRLAIITTSIRPSTTSMVSVSLMWPPEFDVAHQVAQFGHEQPHVDALGDDQAEVQRRLEPAAPENEVLEKLRTFSHGFGTAVGSPDFIIGEARSKAVKWRTLLFCLKGFTHEPATHHRAVAAGRPLRIKVSALREHFSEFGLIRNRVKVEIEWLKAWPPRPNWPRSRRSPPPPSPSRRRDRQLSVADGEAVKAIEATTNHDVKAMDTGSKQPGPQPRSHPRHRVHPLRLHLRKTSTTSPTR